jgi:hypothetical protein
MSENSRDSHGFIVVRSLLNKPPNKVAGMRRPVITLFLESHVTTSSSLPHLFHGFLILSFLLLSTGCIWRSADTDYLWGPALVHMNQPPQGNAYLWEERSVVPLVLEGGEHMGLTIGFLKRVAANPVEHDKQASLQWCKGLLGTSCSTPTASDGWQWNFLYGRIVHIVSPEFYDRSVLGASVGGGSDDGYVTIGYSADSRHRPQDNAYYILCYGRANPLQTRFELARTMSEFATLINQEACR